MVELTLLELELLDIVGLLVLEELLVVEELLMLVVVLVLVEELLVVAGLVVVGMAGKGSTAPGAGRAPEALPVRTGAVRDFSPLELPV